MSREFNNIALFHAVPDLFCYNEVFRFNGVIEEETTALYSIVYVYFQEVGPEKKSFFCKEYVKRGQKEFEVSCQMKMVG